MLDKKKIKELEQKLENISDKIEALEDAKIEAEKELDRLSRDTSIELPEPGTMFLVFSIMVKSLNTSTTENIATVLIF